MNNYYVYSTLFFVNLDESVQFTRKKQNKAKKNQNSIRKECNDLKRA